MKAQNSLTEGKIFSSLLRFAFPFLFASLLQALYGATDVLIVGQFSNSASVSAVAIGSQLMQTITGIILGLTTGGTILIGQYLGANRKKDVAKTIGTIICLFSIISIILTIIMLILTNPIANIMNIPKEALVSTKQYIFICSCGIPFIVGYNTVSGIFRGLGDSKSPLIFIAIACIINAVVGLFLVGFFHIGAAGTAIATILAQATSLILAIFFLKRHGFNFEFNKNYISLNHIKARQILKLGAPIALQDGLINISFLIITAIINTMGLTASASVGVVEKIIIFAMLPSSAFSSAIAVTTAQNIGAGKPDRARKCLYIGIGCSLIFGVLFCSYSQFNAGSITKLFSKDLAVIKMSSLYLKSYSIDCILVSFVFCMNSFFSGCSHPIFPMIHSMFATFVFRIPLSYFISQKSGTTLYDIGFASPTATLVSLIICIIYMNTGQWKKDNIRFQS